MRVSKVSRENRPLVKSNGVKGLDPGIAHEVKILRENGVETVESCQGGQGHPFPEPTVRFAGGKSEGPRALGIAMQYGLPVTALRRVWSIIDGEAVGPVWEMTFTSRTATRVVVVVVLFLRVKSRNLRHNKPPTQLDNQAATTESLRNHYVEALLCCFGECCFARIGRESVVGQLPDEPGSSEL
jgi:hypothetical protein